MGKKQRCPMIARLTSGHKLPTGMMTDFPTIVATSDSPMMTVRSLWERFPTGSALSTKTLNSGASKYQACRITAPVQRKEMLWQIGKMVVHTTTTKSGSSRTNGSTFPPGNWRIKFLHHWTIQGLFQKLKSPPSSSRPQQIDQKAPILECPRVVSQVPSYFDSILQVPRRYAKQGARLSIFPSPGPKIQPSTVSTIRLSYE